jgi:hypothetical protein
MRRYGVIIVFLLVASLASGVANAAILNGFETTNLGQDMTIDLTIDTTLDTVEIVMTGPEAVWFAVGFEPLNHPSGADTYSVVPLGGAPTADVQEWALGNHSAGIQLPDSLTVDSNSVSAGVRTVELSGPASTSAGGNYNYPTDPGEMEISWAYGNGPDFAFHADRGEENLILSLVPEPTTLTLLGMAGLGLCSLKRRRR